MHGKKRLQHEFESENQPSEKRRIVGIIRCIRPMTIKKIFCWKQVCIFFLQKKKIRKTATIALYALCFKSTKLRKVVFWRFQCLTMYMISYLEHLLINCRILSESQKFRKYLTEKNCYVPNQKRKQPNDHTISTSPNMDLLFIYVAIFRGKIQNWWISSLNRSCSWKFVEN